MIYLEKKDEDYFVFSSRYFPERSVVYTLPDGYAVIGADNGDPRICCGDQMGDRMRFSEDASVKIVGLNLIAIKDIYVDDEITFGYG